MKKLMSSAVAAIITASSLSALHSSAIILPEFNDLSYSTEVLTEATTVDSTIIPAGVTAVTVSIDNNNGFLSSATKIDIGSASVIVDEYDNPVFIRGDVLENSIVASAANESSVVFSSASANESTESGEMFTFYVQGNCSDLSVTDITDFNYSVSSIPRGESIMSTRYEFYIGDVNDNGNINSSDASFVLAAVSSYTPTPDEPKLTVTTANNNISYYLPYSSRAEAADTNKNGKITDVDAEFILQFYSYVSTGYSWDWTLDHLSDEYGNYCGEFTAIII